MTPDQQAPMGKGAALALLAMTQFVVILDASIVNVALPSIGTALEFSQDNLSWVVNAYTLTFGGFLLLGGRLADLLGRRRMFIIGLVLFSAASLLGGLAQSDLWGCGGLRRRSGGAPRRRAHRVGGVGVGPVRQRPDRRCRRRTGASRAAGEPRGGGRPGVRRDGRRPRDRGARASRLHAGRRGIGRLDLDADPRPRRAVAGDAGGVCRVGVARDRPADALQHLPAADAARR